MAEAVAVRRMMEGELIQLKGVVGVSHKNPRERIVIYVESPQDALAMPRSLSGVPVQAIPVGKVVAMQLLMLKNRARLRPVVGGASISYPERIAGTLGVITEDGRILTNSHVIAMRWSTAEFNSTGTPIIQPALMDGGSSFADVIGGLENYIPITFNDPEANNLVDAATGTLTADAEPMNILDIGKVVGWSDPVEGMVVRKSGRTTGLTQNTIFDTNATMKVGYGPFGFAVFRDVALTYQPYIDHGDSGSISVCQNNCIVGLNFAGSEKVGVMCKARHVIDALGVDLGKYYEPPPPIEIPEITPGSPVALGLSFAPIAVVGGIVSSALGYRF